MLTYLPTGRRELFILIFQTKSQIMRPSGSNGKKFVFKNYRSNVTILGHSQLRDFRGKYRNQRANISMCPGASIREALIKQYF